MQIINREDLMPTLVRIEIGPFKFKGMLEEEKAPATCDAIKELLPMKNKVVHVRWSGEAVWIPFGNKKLDLEPENHTCYPQRGEVVVYPGGISEMEIFIPYGHCAFSSKLGRLPGNHFLTFTEGLDQLPALGEKVLWEGAQDISIETIS